MRLFGVELRRLAGRRLFQWVVALFVAGIVVAGILVYVNNDGGFRRSDIVSAMIGMAFPLLMVGWLIGASSIGAEWGPRTVTSLLTWEPRRTQVLVTKAAAAVTFTAVVVVLLEGAFTLALLPGAAADPPGAGIVWSEHAATGGRILLVSLVACLLGFSLATIGKNTAAALGGGLAYLLIVENLIRAYKSEWTSWLLGSNMGRVIEGGPGFGLAERTTTGAAAVLVVYALALLLVALWFFDRREMA